jgi:hypothetical protein
VPAGSVGTELDLTGAHPGAQAITAATDLDGVPTNVVSVGLEGHRRSRNLAASAIHRFGLSRRAALTLLVVWRVES